MPVPSTPWSSPLIRACSISAAPKPSPSRSRHLCCPLPTCPPPPVNGILEVSHGAVGWRRFGWWSSKMALEAVRLNKHNSIQPEWDSWNQIRDCPVFVWTYKPGLLAIVQYFSLTIKQHQPSYQLQKLSAEQLMHISTSSRISKYYVNIKNPKESQISWFLTYTTWATWNYSIRYYFQKRYHEHDRKANSYP
jgi:hypothetical protein